MRHGGNVWGERTLGELLPGVNENWRKLALRKFQFRIVYMIPRCEVNRFFPVRHLGRVHHRLHHLGQSHWVLPVHRQEPPKQRRPSRA
jgi:hypothetical protein